MDETARFLIRSILAENPGLSAFEISTQLAAHGIRLRSHQIKLELEGMTDATAARRPDHRQAWSVRSGAAGIQPHHDSLNDDWEVTYRGPELRRWQIRALRSWRAADRRGVIEAITGTGKSLVGIKAVEEVVRDGGRALVVVPGVALLQQWRRGLEAEIRGIRIAALGDGASATFYDNDVLIASVQSGYRHRPVPPGLGLLVADEVHRYGAPTFAQVLSDRFDRRLGLTGTYERIDDGITTWLDPYFGGVAFEYRYADALLDKVVAPFHLAMVGVSFTDIERSEHDRFDKECKDTATALIEMHGYPRAPWSAFFEAVQSGAASPDWNEAQICRRHLAAFMRRKELLAAAVAKSRILKEIGIAWIEAGQALVFTETVSAAKNAAAAIGEFTPAAALTGDITRRSREMALRRRASPGSDRSAAPGRRYRRPRSQPGGHRRSQPDATPDGAAHGAGYQAEGRRPACSRAGPLREGHAGGPCPWRARGLPRRGHSTCTKYSHL
ncbi:MAG: hypothetical protein EPO13_05950 [Actinomycetota bacterium]|nr:MAG: hypothetical protein EPO13_05950 [Actinomycetota bacterium]